MTLLKPELSQHQVKNFISSQVCISQQCKYVVAKLQTPERVQGLYERADDNIGGIVCNFKLMRIIVLIMIN